MSWVVVIPIVQWAGTVQAENEEMTVYPNPIVSDAEVIITVQPGVYELQLHDVCGKYKETLLRGQSTESRTITYEFQRHRYPGNIYIIRLVTDHGVKTQRVVIDP